MNNLSSTNSHRINFSAFEPVFDNSKSSGSTEDPALKSVDDGTLNDPTFLATLEQRVRVDCEGKEFEHQIPQELQRPLQESQVLFAQFWVLKNRICNYPPGQIPQEIEELLAKKSLTPGEITFLQNWVQNRDCLVVWERLAREIGEMIDFSGDFQSAQGVIERGEGLSHWIGENHDRLSRVADLNLSCLSLISIPKELKALIGLTSLDLSENQIISIPKELSELSELQVLNLRSNDVITVPKDLGRMLRLRELNLSDNSIHEIPEEVERNVPWCAY